VRTVRGMSPTSSTGGLRFDPVAVTEHDEGIENCRDTVEDVWREPQRRQSEKSPELGVVVASGGQAQIRRYVTPFTSLKPLRIGPSLETVGLGDVATA
jgi:hypothetical protein